MGDGRRNDLFTLFLTDVTISHLRRHGYERTNGPNKFCFSPLSVCCSPQQHGGGAVSGWRQPGGIASVQLTTDSINCVPSGGQREYKLATWNRLFCPKVRERSGGNQVGNRGKWPPIATRPCLAMNPLCDSRILTFQSGCRFGE